MARWLPTLGVKDLERETRFFTALGFEVVEQWPGGVQLRLGGAEVVLEPFESLRVGDAPLLDWEPQPSQLGAGAQLYLLVDDVDGLAARLPVGVPRPWPVQNKSWGFRELTLRTPSGYVLTLAQRL